MAGLSYVAETLSMLVVIEAVWLSILRKERKARHVFESIAVETDIKIDETVAIVIGETRRDAARLEIETHLLRLIDKPAAGITEEFVRREVTSNEEISIAVVVHVGKQTSICLVYSLEAGFTRHVGEFDVAPLVTHVAVESRPDTVGKEDVLAAIVIIIGCACPSRSVFDDVALHLR